MASLADGLFMTFLTGTLQSYAKTKNRYGLLVDEFDGSNHTNHCQQILETNGFSAKDYQLGRTRVFLRVGVVVQLEKLRHARLNGAAFAIQTFGKRYLAANFVQKAITAVHTIQTCTIPLV